MTVKDKLLLHLTDKGMSDSQAEIVLTDYLKSISQDTNYQISLDDVSDAYPKEVYYALYSGLKHEAIQWIEKNVPLAWFKPMFL